MQIIGSLLSVILLLAAFRLQLLGMAPPSLWLSLIICAALVSPLLWNPSSGPLAAIAPKAYVRYGLMIGIMTMTAAVNLTPGRIL